MTDWTIWQGTVLIASFFALFHYHEKAMPIFWAVVAANIFLKAVF